jgi:hypothetical protein
VAGIEQGRIIWVEVADPSGKNKKCRPAVVLTPTAEVRAGQPFAAVAGSTSTQHPLSSDRIELPWDSSGNCRTRLRKRTVAVCSWLLQVREEDIRQFGGVVPPKIMLEIYRRAIRD